MRKKITLLIFICLALSACPPQEQETHSLSKDHAHQDMDMTEMKISESEDPTLEMDMSQMEMPSSDITKPAKSTEVKDIKKSKVPKGKPQIIYRGPMHPHITSDKPGKCPICHMDLEPVVLGEETGSKTPTGLSKVKISARKQQLIGVKTHTLKKEALKHKIRTLGKIGFNETQLAHVHTKYAGWIEHVFVDFKGKFVKKGQPLFQVYSPDLVAAQQEYLTALKISRQFQNPDLVSTQDMSRSLLQVAGDKLRLWDLSLTQIKNLARTGHIRKHITVYAPTSGVVMETQALKGMRVTAGTPLYTLANLSTVWINAQVYEYEIPQVKVGDHAEVSLPYLPGKKFSGKVSYIAPYLDPQSRTAEVRIVLSNSQGTLKPDMFADIEIQANTNKEALLIPISAVMDSGKRKIVYIAQKDGYFEPQEITVGPRVGNAYILKAGPVAGEKVVTDANFLIDAESQLNAVINQMTQGHNHVR